MAEASYKYLKSYQLTVIIYDLTVEFCQRFLSGFDYRRLREQMIQAARSGKQNIAEGSQLQSLKGYIKLCGVAKGSLKELLEDYEDYLRQRKLAIWSKDSPMVRKIRGIRLVDKPDLPDSPEKAANLLITIINQATFLLDKQIQSLEEKFVKEGGYTEALFRQRINSRYGKINPT